MSENDRHQYRVRQVASPEQLEATINQMAHDGYLLSQQPQMITDAVMSKIFYLAIFYRYMN